MGYHIPKPAAIAKASLPELRAFLEATIVAEKAARKKVHASYAKQRDYWDAREGELCVARERLEAEIDRRE